jgi:3-hydroxy acid dehydrogenase / malonic semialdehyde reductase
MSRTILVTGATSGFGKAIAEKFAAERFNVIITGRRKDRLDEITKSLAGQYSVRVHALELDVQDRDAVTAAINGLPEEWKKIDILVNNAGLALGRDYFEEASLDDWDTMIDTNLKGLIYVTKAVVPFMIRGKAGHIINIGSTAGKEVYEKGNVYCATKHAVDAISKAMRIDLLRHAIKVTSVHPGAAETEFSKVRFKGDEATAGKVYEGYKALEAKDIADICYYCATLPSHVCINDLVVTCTAQANSFLTFKS